MPNHRFHPGDVVRTSHLCEDEDIAEVRNSKGVIRQYNKRMYEVEWATPYGMIKLWCKAKDLCMERKYHG